MIRLTASHVRGLGRPSPLESKRRNPISTRTSHFPTGSLGGQKFQHPHLYPLPQALSVVDKASLSFSRRVRNASVVTSAQSGGGPSSAKPPSWLLRDFDEIWQNQLQPLADCGVLPYLPTVDAVSHIVITHALQNGFTVGTTPDGLVPNPSQLDAASALLLNPQRLYDKILSHVQLSISDQPISLPIASLAAVPGPPEAVPVALCITSAILEHMERRRARRARLAAVESTPSAGGPALWAPSSGVYDAPDDGDGRWDSDDTDVDIAGVDGTAAPPLGLHEFLSRMNHEGIAQLLVSVLGQPLEKLPDQLAILDKVGVGGVAAVLEATLDACRPSEGALQRKDGGQRSIGGVFFAQLKKYKSQVSQAEARAAVEGWEPMRPYQRDLVGMVLACWGLPLTPDLLSSNQWLSAGAAAQRSDAARYRQLGGEWGGNWLVSAPTNSGKTLMFLEVARGVVAAARASRPQSRGSVVVVLVPSVNLTFQHKAYFERANLPYTVVRAVSSEDKLSYAEWLEVLREARRPAGRSHVLICTAAAFLNLLVEGGGGCLYGTTGESLYGSGAAANPGVAHWWPGLEESVAEAAEALAGAAPDGKLVDLLVLDEAHHCQGDHPYSTVVQLLSPRPAPASSAAGDDLARLSRPSPLGSVGQPGPSSSSPSIAPRILAVTASPAGRTNKTSLVADMSRLLGLLGAQLHVLDPDDTADLERVLPRPREREVRVAAREEERSLVQRLQNFALDVAEGLAADITIGGGLRAEGDVAIAAVASLRQELHSALFVCRSSRLSPNEMVSSRMQQLMQWTAQARSFAARYKCPRLDLTCRLLDICCKAAEVADDVGYEGVLPYLARKAAAVCREELRWEARRRQAASDANDAGGATAAEPSPYDTASGAAATADSTEPAEPAILTQLRALAAAAAPAAAAAQAQEAAARVALIGPPPGSSCEDVTIPASHWVSRLLLPARDGEVTMGLLYSPVADLMYGDPYGSPVRQCFASGDLTEKSFPKFSALVNCLRDYTARDNFHGVVFVRTRQAVFHLSDLLRRTQQLEGVEVLELVGQANGTNTSSPDCLPGERDRASRGMGGAAQMRALHRFRAPGRKVLVATSAVEEGLDVPSCEFVVRYNAAGTGIQLCQSRGRARVRDAEFVAILQEYTLDEKLHSKSRLEEQIMTEYQKQYGNKATGGQRRV